MRWRLVLLAGTLVLAGCGASSSGPVVASGTPAAVDAQVLESMGYERVGTTNRTLNTTVRATISGDVEMNAQREVRATTPLATYRRSTASGPALFVVATAPAVRPIENQPVVRNPLTADGTGALVAYVQSTYAVESLTRGPTRNVTMLDNETAARVSTGEGVRDGQRVPLRITVASVLDDDEFVTVVAVASRSTAERERVQRLAGGIVH